MAERFSMNELVAFLLSEIIRLNVNSELTMTILREKGLIPEYEARYKEILKSTVDGMTAKFPFLQPFFQELYGILSEEKVVKESEPTPNPSYPPPAPPKRGERSEDEKSKQNEEK